MVQFIRRLWMYPKAIMFTIYTLTYNAFKSRSPITDCAFEPVFWIVDHFAGVIGRVLVVLVVCLTSTVVVIFYIFVLPIVLEYNFWLMVCHLLCGHWLLWNIAFHYYKAVSTSPGYPPSGKQALAVKNFQVCTKCIQPKPLRTHHCSVCNNCILKMDHHCPWVNNCIGHFNHRYFFLFCVYMFLGTVYVSVTTFPKILEHLGFHAKNIFKDYYFVAPTSGRSKYLLNSKNFLKDYFVPTAGPPSDVLVDKSMDSIHNVVIFEFMLCSCVSVAVGGLALWHAILISRGETSVETYINKSEKQQKKKEGCKFINPYHYGFIKNWRMLLGLGHGRGLWTIIFPSSHLPNGDGMTWPQLTPLSENNHCTTEKRKGAFMA